MRRHALLAAVVLGSLSGCGGDGPTVIPPVTTTTTLATVPTTQPSASPTPSTQECNLAPGPVARFAISPRELRTDGEQVDIWVRARPNWDEVVCIDKAKTHRMDFNANQRNADGRESCYVGDVEWRILDDDQMVTGSGSRHPDNFIWRLNIEPRGRDGQIALNATLDGLNSYPWQSGSGYRQEPLRIVAMSANEIARDCNCIYRGNGVYEGGRCPKL
jgi:predicted small lipoprotein YifL